MAGYQQRWDRVRHSLGQLITSAEIEELALNPHRTMRSFLQDLFIGQSALERSGVLYGMVPTVGGGALDVDIGRGCGFAFSNAVDIANGCGYLPAVNEVTVTKTLGAPDAVNPRYDLIVANASDADVDVAARSVRLMDGSLVSQNLPGRSDWSAVVTVVPGVAAPAPFVPLTTRGYIPIAAVYVPPLPAAIIVHDVRPFLRPRNGGVAAYHAMARIAGVGAGDLTVLVERVTDPNIRIAMNITGLTPGVGLQHYVHPIAPVLGEYLVALYWPFTFGSHPTSLFCDPTLKVPPSTFHIGDNSGILRLAGGAYWLTQTRASAEVVSIPGPAVTDAWDPNVYTGRTIYAMTAQEAAGSFALADAPSASGYTLSGRVEFLADD